MPLQNFSLAVWSPARFTFASLQRLRLVITIIMSTQFYYKGVKMKKYLLVILASMLVFNCAGPTPQGYPYSEASGQFEYEDVVTVDSIPSNEIYNSFKKWVAQNYNSSKDVIQLDDDQNNHMIIRGKFNTDLFGKSGWYDHTINLYAKDGRYKYNIIVSSYYSVGSGTMGFNSVGFKETIFEDVDNKVQNTIKGLEKSITSKSVQDSNW